MARTDPYEAQIMRQCQRGDPLPHGGYTGSVCRKPKQCYAEKVCHFVADYRRYLDKHREEVVVFPSHSVDVPTIQWHPGYDGYRWAI